MKKMKTQTLVLSALLMAMHIILSYFSIDLPQKCRCFGFSYAVRTDDLCFGHCLQYVLHPSSVCGIFLTTIRPQTVLGKARVNAPRLLLYSRLNYVLHQRLRQIYLLPADG